MRLYEAAAILGARILPKDARDFAIESLSCGMDPIGSKDCYGVFAEYFACNQWFEESISEDAARRAQPGAVVARGSIPGYKGVVLAVENPRKAFGHLARAFYGYPDKHMALVGVTGTNGKTTTSTLVAHLAGRLTKGSGAIGTLGAFHNGTLWEPGEFTTNLALAGMKTLSRMAESGTEVVAMEVSSHGLALDRVAGLNFKVAVLTNITRDHLDFHGSEEAYFAAKMKLFDRLNEESVAVLNADDRSAGIIAARTKARVLSYGWNEAADWKIEEAQVDHTGCRARIRVKNHTLPMHTRLVGRFQISNVIAAAAAVAALGHDPADVLDAVSDFEPVAGRMEAFPLRNGATAIIDYAHNPDGLANLLANCREMSPRRILLVFGCGGDRDRGKRPIMGEIAARGADLAWVTSDNPRTEDPAQIIDDILQGMAGRQAHAVEPDRAKAIRGAWEASENGDLLVIAGKGHENYQLIGTTKYPFNDKDQIARLNDLVVED